MVIIGVILTITGAAILAGGVVFLAIGLVNKIIDKD